eukprot:g2251.t1
MYYYNSATQESTYEKPDALKNNAERALPRCDWDIHHAPDGRPYYSHKVTRQSVWEEPAEYKAWREAKHSREASSKSKSSRKAAKSSVGNSSVKGQKKKTASSDAKSERVSAIMQKNYSPDEARDIFWKLLEEVGVRSDTRWKMIAGKISKDPRFHVYKKNGQRKQSFSEYTGKRRKIEINEARIRNKRARKNFAKLLGETEGITSRSRFRDMVSVMERDPRFAALESRAEREEMFEDFVREMYDREREERRKREAEHLKIFESFLSALDEPLTHASTWRELSKKYEENEEFKSVDTRIARDVFERRVSMLRREKREREAKELEMRIQKEKELLRSFRKLLRSLANEGKVTRETSWTDVESMLASNEVFVAVADIKGNRVSPRDILTRLAEALDEEARICESVLVRIAKTSGHDDDPKPDTTYDMFRKRIIDAATTSKEDGEIETGEIVEVGEIVDAPEGAAAQEQISPISLEKMSRGEKKDVARTISSLPELETTFGRWTVETAFRDMKKIAAERHERKIRKRKKYAKRFMELLSDYYDSVEHAKTTYEIAEMQLSHRSAWRNVDDPHQRRKLFDAHIATLTQANVFDDNLGGTVKNVEPVDVDVAMHVSVEEQQSTQEIEASEETASKEANGENGRVEKRKRTQEVAVEDKTSPEKKRLRTASDEDKNKPVALIVDDLSYAELRKEIKARGGKAKGKTAQLRALLKSLLADGA